MAEEPVGGRRSTARRWRMGRRVVTGAGLTAVIAVCASVFALSSAAGSSPPVSPGPAPIAEQFAGIRSGLAFHDPPALNTATPANLHLRLVAAPTLFHIGGKAIWGASYNGSYIGPTLHFAPGEHVTLTLVNKLSTATNLHFHGLHVSPSGSSDNPFISVPPGHTFVYHLNIPDDQPQGTFWYHDHDMCMGVEPMRMAGMSSSMRGMKMPAVPACSDIESQILAGLSGTIIVGNDRGLLPAGLRSITAHTLVFKDFQTNAAGHIVQNSGSFAIDSNQPTVRVVNGELRPILTMRPGQTELWRLSNEGADIFYKLALQGYSFTVIGQDGYPSAAVTTANTLLLPPAKRYDVLVTAHAHPGEAWLQTLAINLGPGGDDYPTVDLLKLKVAGAPVPAAAMPTGAIPTAEPNLADSPIAQNRTLKLSESPDGSIMYINGKTFSMTKSIFSTPAVLGTTEQWTIENLSSEIHPFHVHTEHFQVMSINGVPQPYIGQQDVIPVPYDKDGVPGKVVIRMHFTDFTGKVMFHCHIAAHEDAGMMSYVNVVKPSSTAAPARRGVA